EDLLNVDAFKELAVEVATMVGLIHGDDGELTYPASCREFGISDEAVEWVPIRHLFDYINDLRWFNGLSGTQMRFWVDVWRFMMDHGRPPDLEEVPVPPDIVVFEAEEGPSTALGID
ncbi:unnamed protein product, partial [marine sediment metagenome]